MLPFPASVGVQNMRRAEQLLDPGWTAAQIGPAKKGSSAQSPFHPLLFSRFVQMCHILKVYHNGLKKTTISHIGTKNERGDDYVRTARRPHPSAIAGRCGRAGAPARKRSGASPDGGNRQHPQPDLLWAVRGWQNHRCIHHRQTGRKKTLPAEWYDRFNVGHPGGSRRVRHHRRDRWCDPLSRRDPVSE